MCGGTHVNNLKEINFFEIWDCWVDKKKVRIQFSTNKEVTESYFANWINQKKIIYTKTNTIPRNYPK
ncbi:hypothetical protein [Spiroplasma kunkelii]|uniref:hypothetical protein n=1 Tax=Spiroplasma kunkelii TaxID=47834 RepID=UPI001F48DAA8|nr:hypothetical protein [Spiroplasma kunkelii]